jgi:uncharacterized protein YbjT (DUF2867 family)
MQVILFGATGMVGQGVLLEALADPDVASVLVVGRTPLNMQHAKLREIIHTDFFDYAALEPRLTGLDACFFCLGVSSAGMTEERYRRITHDLTLAAATTLARLNTAMTFCFVSGQGTDSTAKGRIMWARVKGQTENDLLQLPFKAAYMFRPGYIQPRKGIVSKTLLYRVFYAILAPAFPLLKALFPKYVTTTDAVGRAMLAVSKQGYHKPILDNSDINALGA